MKVDMFSRQTGHWTTCWGSGGVQFGDGGLRAVQYKVRRGDRRVGEVHCDRDCHVKTITNTMTDKICLSVINHNVNTSELLLIAILIFVVYFLFLLPFQH